jgi:hypothetical protein
MLPQRSVSHFRVTCVATSWTDKVFQSRLDKYVEKISRWFPTERAGSGQVGFVVHNVALG